ncbi:MAG: hypothetical protein MJZ81_07830 [Bacteroidales bacterium]|nr:hypothetical protein [Bacteroidales bacterium]
MRNIHVYGLSDSVRASKYPMVTDINMPDETVTDRVRKLACADPGSGHDQFLTGIVVQFDLTFSVKAWVEAERYHFLDFVSSQSTMHRITQFDIGAQCNEWVDERVIYVVREMVEKYNADPSHENYLRVLYNVPVGFQLTARMTTNYRQLKTIYAQRKGHRLPEWRAFCHQLNELPYSEFITRGMSEE